MSALKRLTRIAVTVLLSWVVGFVVLAYLGWIPHFGLLGWLFELEDYVTEITASESTPLAGAAARRPFPAQVQPLVDAADSDAAAGRFRSAADGYAASARLAPDHPELLFSAAQAYRFADLPAPAAIYMLAYVQAASLHRDVRLALLGGVDDLASGLGATARELFGMAVDGAARLPVDARYGTQVAVVRNIALAGDIGALQVIARKAPQGLIEGIDSAAIGAAEAGRWRLAQELLETGIASVAEAARASVLVRCPHRGREAACTSRIVHPGFGGLPPVRTEDRCGPAIPPPEIAARQTNLAGLMMMGLAISEYRIGLRQRAHEHWQEGKQLLAASNLDVLCEQPWVKPYIPLRAGSDWVFMGDKGPIGLPAGNDQLAYDAEPSLPDWRDVAGSGQLPLPDWPMALDHAELMDLAAELSSTAQTVDRDFRPVRLAQIGRTYFRLFTALRRTVVALSGEGGR